MVYLCFAFVILFKTLYCIIIACIIIKIVVVVVFAVVIIIVAVVVTLEYLQKMSKMGYGSCYICAV